MASRVTIHASRVIRSTIAVGEEGAHECDPRGRRCRMLWSERHCDTSFGRMRSRTVGQHRAAIPEVVVVVQGMAVADCLMPAVAELGRWTRANLVELPSTPTSSRVTSRASSASTAHSESFLVTLHPTPSPWKNSKPFCVSTAAEN